MHCLNSFVVLSFLYRAPQLLFDENPYLVNATCHTISLMLIYVRRKVTLLVWFKLKPEPSLQPMHLLYMIWGKVGYTAGMVQIYRSAQWSYHWNSENSLCYLTFWIETIFWRLIRGRATMRFRLFNLLTRLYLTPPGHKPNVRRWLVLCRMAEDTHLLQPFRKTHLLQ